ncbi:MAG: carbamoyltransferase HypF [bacterium]
MSKAQTKNNLAAYSVKITGTVQGVGFRPFVYRLADRFDLTGRVRNDSAGVEISVEGPADNLQKFLSALQEEVPPAARVELFEYSEIQPENYSEFKIEKSSGTGKIEVDILPDLATCADCREELFDPSDRRHRYSFINCTNCGPRYSIIQSLPYDRPRTTMEKFEMCPECQKEYEEPLDRRFHAQPNACPECGPHLEWTDSCGKVKETRNEALARCVELVEKEEVVAVKGLGGFHLLADGRSPAAVDKLRRGKKRPSKPLALMYPDLQRLEEDCRVDGREEDVLLSAESPIVLLEKRKEISIAPGVAPGVADLGAMLPYTPLHHLLLDELGFPVVASSGNISGQPICIDNEEAIEKLGGIVGGFLMHNRPILRRVDDSVVRVVDGELQVIRRARGYAPRPVGKVENLPNMLAAGPRKKNTVGISRNGQLILSQHLGDLDSAASVDNFEQTIQDLQQLYELDPEGVVSDLHPDYYSTNYARNRELENISVQHHHAHAVSCMVDNQLNLQERVLAVCWDGTGYGRDGTIWGGEFLQVTGGDFSRIAHLRQFNLPGSDRAVMEPRRSLLGILFETGELAERTVVDELSLFDKNEFETVVKALESNINSPRTSSMGRLFDAFSALVGLAPVVDYSGQAPAELEKLARNFQVDNKGITTGFNFEIHARENKLVVDWAPVFKSAVDKINNGMGKTRLAYEFHQALGDLIVEIARRQKLENVILTGGCFQNKLLTELSLAKLRRADFTPYIHKTIPPNDGGIAAGQLAVAGDLLSKV